MAEISNNYLVQNEMSEMPYDLSSLVKNVTLDRSLLHGLLLLKENNYFCGGVSH